MVTHETARSATDERQTRGNVTLVHGTWAPNAAWTKDDSKIRKALEDSGFDCHRFRWSGGNSHRARIVAAEKLAEHLREQRAKAPTVPQTVIAHSHGGNVAVHAVWRILLQEDGAIRVVTLATPFILAAHKRVYGVITFLAVIGGLVLAPFGFLRIFAGPGSLPLWADRLLVILTILAWFQLISVAYWLVRNGGFWRKESRDRFVSAVDAPTIKGGGLEVVRAAGDEASATLAVGQLVGRLSTLGIQLARPQAWATICAVLSVLAWATTSVFGASTGDTALGIVLSLIVGAYIVSFVAVSVPAVASLVYGLDGPTASLFGFISPEATPPGECTIIQRPQIDRLDVARLLHSRLYDDEETISCVVRRLRARP